MLSILVCVISHISAVLHLILIRSQRALLVMTIKLLNIQTPSTLMGTQGIAGLQSLILGPCPALRMQMLA